MKKIYAFLTVALVALTANAQNFKVVLDDDTEVQDGGTITTYAQEHSMDIGGDEPYRYVECAPDAPYVVNLTNVSIKVYGTVTAATTADNDKVQWCGFNDSCNPVKTSGVSKESSCDPNGKLSMQIHGQFNKVGEYNTYTANVSLSSGTQSFQYTQVFIYDHEHSSGIADVKLDIKTAKIYDTEGRRVSPTKLKRGEVYVINGKRCLITK